MPFDFNANRTVEKIDVVPEDFRPFYVESSDGSGFTLADSPQVASAVKVISGLYKTVSNTRKEADDLRGQSVDLSPLKDYGDTPEEIATAFTAKIEEIKKSGKSNADVEDQLNKLRRDLTDVHTAEKTKWGERETGLIKQIRNLLVDNVINEALGDSAVSPKMARRVISDFVDIEADENGNFRTIVKDAENGGARKNVTDGQLFTVEDLVKELKGHDDYKPLFKSDAPKGSGSRPGAPSRFVDRKPDAGEGKSSLDKIKSGLDARARSRA